MSSYVSCVSHSLTFSCVSFVSHLLLCTQITLVNIMADQPRRLFDIRYEGQSVGSAAFGAPHTEGIYFHNRISVYDAMRQKVTFRAVSGAGEL